MNSAASRSPQNEDGFFFRHLLNGFLEMFNKGRYLFKSTAVYIEIYSNISIFKYL